VSDTVVRVENLVKKYVTRSRGTNTTLRDVITSSASSLSRKLLNPSGSQSPYPSRGGVWALKDVSFSISRKSSGLSVKRAGKSTLLKILSRIMNRVMDAFRLRTSGKFVGGGNRLSPRTNRRERLPERCYFGMSKAERLSLMKLSVLRK